MSLPSQPQPVTAATRSFAVLLGALAFPWFLHAGVVLPSAIGWTPLIQLTSSCLLVGALVFAGVLARTAWRASPSAPVSPLTRSTTDAADNIALTLAGLGLLALALTTLAALSLPHVAYDALAYRLPTIAQWLDAGRIAWVDSDDPVRNGYPLGQEAVSAVFAAASGSLRMAAASSSLFVLAGASALVWLARACGLRESFALATLGMFLLVPMVLLNAASGYVDAAFAGAGVALFCSAALFDTAGAAPPLLAAAALGMAASLTLSLKGTGLPFVAIAVFGLAVRAFRARRMPDVRALGIAFVCAVPGAFWVLRNIAHTGNPLWPVTVQIAGHTLLPGIGSMEQIIDTVHNTPPELARLGALSRIAATWLQLHGPAQDFDDRLAGLGYAWPLFAVPAVATFCVRQARARTRDPKLAPITFVLALCALCFALQPMKWWPRYALWIWSGGALALAAQAERLARAGRKRLLGLLALGIATVVVLEGGNALAHANGVHLTLRHRSAKLAPGDPRDPRYAQNTLSWVAPAFWDRGIEREHEVCRGAWKPGTDDANLDGVFAQLDPRPRVHILADDAAYDWPRIRNRARALGCSQLLLLKGSPVLPSARLDPGVTVESLVAFDPLSLVSLGHVRREPLAVNAGVVPVK